MESYNVVLLSLEGGRASSADVELTRMHVEYCATLHGRREVLAVEPNEKAVVHVEHVPLSDPIGNLPEKVFAADGVVIVYSTLCRNTYTLVPVLVQRLCNDPVEFGHRPRAFVVGGYCADDEDLQDDAREVSLADAAELSSALGCFVREFVGSASDDGAVKISDAPTDDGEHEVDATRGSFSMCLAALARALRQEAHAEKSLLRVLQSKVKQELAVRARLAAIVLAYDKIPGCVYDDHLLQQIAQSDWRLNVLRERIRSTADGSYAPVDVLEMPVVPSGLRLSQEPREWARERAVSPDRRQHMAIDLRAKLEREKKLREGLSKLIGVYKTIPRNAHSNVINEIRESDLRYGQINRELASIGETPVSTTQIAMPLLRQDDAEPPPPPQQENVDQRRGRAETTTSKLSRNLNRSNAKRRQQQTVRLVGRVTVRVRDCVGLSRLCDPFAILSVGKQESATKKVKKTNSPAWDEQFIFDVTAASKDIVISVNDWKLFAKDDFLGTVTVPIASLPEGRAVTESRPLLTHAGEKAGGDITLTIKFEKLTSALTVANFEILSVVGRGAFGKVMQVRKKDTGQILAMKVVRKNVGDGKHHAALIQEKEIMSRLSHPFITDLQFTFQSESKLYFVLEFVNGGDLYFHMRHVGKFNEERTRFISAEILCAIEYLHSLNIAYRDLKAENVLLDLYGHVRLVDFGLAKMGLGEGDKTTTMCGTPDYLAPEILLRNSYDRSVDFWALGVLTWEMLAGHPPFESETVDGTFKNTLFRPIGVALNLLRAEVPALSSEAEALLLELLERDPKRRLGAAEGAKAVRAHRFFAPIDFDKLLAKQLSPPFKPRVKNEKDVRNFDSRVRKEQPRDTLIEGGAVEEDSVASLFRDFSFTRRATVIAMQPPTHGANAAQQPNVAATVPPGQKRPDTTYEVPTTRPPPPAGPPPASVLAEFANANANTAAADGKRPDHLYEVPTTKPPPPAGPPPASVLASVAAQQQKDQSQPQPQPRQRLGTGTFTPSSQLKLQQQQAQSGASPVSTPPPATPPPPQAQPQSPTAAWRPKNAEVLPVRPPKPDHLRARGAGPSQDEPPAEPTPPPRPPKKRMTPTAGAVEDATPTAPSPSAVPSFKPSSQLAGTVTASASQPSRPSVPETGPQDAQKPATLAVASAERLADVRAAVSAVVRGSDPGGDVAGLLLGTLDLILNMCDALSNIIDAEEFAFSLASAFRDSVHETEFVRLILRRVVASASSSNPSDEGMAHSLLRAYSRCVAGAYVRELVEGCAGDVANAVLGICRSEDDAPTIARAAVMLLDAVVVSEAAVPGPVRRSCAIAASLAAPDAPADAPPQRPRHLSAAALPGLSPSMLPGGDSPKSLSRSGSSSTLTVPGSSPAQSAQGRAGCAAVVLDALVLPALSQPNSVLGEPLASARHYIVQRTLEAAARVVGWAARADPGEGGPAAVHWAGASPSLQAAAGLFVKAGGHAKLAKFLSRVAVEHPSTTSSLDGERRPSVHMGDTTSPDLRLEALANIHRHLMRMITFVSAAIDMSQESPACCHLNELTVSASQRDDLLEIATRAARDARQRLRDLDPDGARLDIRSRDSGVFSSITEFDLESGRLRPRRLGVFPELVALYDFKTREILGMLSTKAVPAWAAGDGFIIIEVADSGRSSQVFVLRTRDSRQISECLASVFGAKTAYRMRTITTFLGTTALLQETSARAISSPLSMWERQIMLRTQDARPPTKEPSADAPSGSREDGDEHKSDAESSVVDDLGPLCSAALSATDKLRACVTAFAQPPPRHVSSVAVLCILAIDAAESAIQALRDETMRDGRTRTGAVARVEIATAEAAREVTWYANALVLKPFNFDKPAEENRVLSGRPSMPVESLRSSLAQTLWAAEAAWRSLLARTSRSHRKDA